MTELEDIKEEIIRTETILETVQIELDMYLNKLKRLKEKKKFLEMMP